MYNDEGVTEVVLQVLLDDLNSAAAVHKDKVPQVLAGADPFEAFRHLSCQEELFVARLTKGHEGDDLDPQIQDRVVVEVLYASRRGCLAWPVRVHENRRNGLPVLRTAIVKASSVH